MAWYQYRDGVLIMQLQVQAGGKSESVVGLHGERLKIRLQTPPVDGRANNRLIEFLADQFGVSRAAVQITHGRSGRAKTVIINNPEQWPEWYRELTLKQ